MSILQKDKLNVQLVPFQMFPKISLVECEKHCTHSRAFASNYDKMSLKWRLPAVKCHMLRLTKEADRKQRDTPPPPVQFYFQYLLQLQSTFLGGVLAVLFFEAI